MPVLTDEGEWIDDASLALLGVMVFPNCERSVWHFRSILGDDEAASPGVQSEVGRIISEDVLSRKRQGHVVGQVALRLIELSVHYPEKVSLNKAVYLTVEAAKQATVEGKPFKPQSTTAIRDAVKHFQSVAHLWAAQVEFPELFVQSSVSTEKLRDFLAVANIFEERLATIPSWSDWRPWRIPAALLGDIAIRVPRMSPDVERTLFHYHPELRK